MLKLHHVGILCDPDFRHRFEDVLNLLGVEGSVHMHIEEFQCDCYMWSGIELVVPCGGSLLNRLHEVGASIHHFAIQVDDIIETSKMLLELGFPLVCEEPVHGVGDILVNFMHPSEFGIQIELVQEIADV